MTDLDIGAVMRSTGAVSNLFMRPADVEPPLAVKIGVGLQACLTLSMLLPAKHPDPVTWGYAIVQGVLLFAAWNMKRWALAGLLGSVVLLTLLALPHLHWTVGNSENNIIGALIGTLWKVALLGPILASWKKMTWT